ncbi:MAG TPA: putative nucleotidyltransferase substrate binding domain-containing protein, partial [Pyrinomonadaceae bacterium]|nr:putative nucleotidyltransferase substrate binding domain-containing protein [Pyrinomonadaceae bacterium]
MKEIESLIKDLPDAESASRFLDQFGAKHPAKSKKLLKKKGLLSDILTLAAYSPLLSTTVLQNPEYISWLEKVRKFSDVREKEDILESLARFALTNSQIDKNVLLARFRRRELLRIYLKDIRNLGTISEVTEDISNLADAILEFSLQTAKQQLDNLYGIPLEIDDKGRAKPAGFCIVSLGKLGSKELNYASDIDLLFLYSAEGDTSGQGSRGAITNKEYFVKLSEFIVKLVGAQTGEGAAYRVDMRLRPHGRVGALAISADEAVNYYQTSAQSWERQVLIRSRASAGDEEIFKRFFKQVEDYVFAENETAENALNNVRLSKEKINFEKADKNGFNVKLGKGGIREIEFIAQALQLAYGGKDEWLRVSHTLKSLQRLTDRKLLTETELTELVEAYKFLRRLEHRLQMENGLQTHRVPDNLEKRPVISQRMGVFFVADFNRRLDFYTNNVNRIFNRVFSEAESFGEKRTAIKKIEHIFNKADASEVGDLNLFYSSLEKTEINLNDEKLKTVEKVSSVSAHFSAMLTANPALIEKLPTEEDDFSERSYLDEMSAVVAKETNFAGQLAVLRKTWSRFLLEIVVFDIFGKLLLKESKHAQTNLAEASIKTALFITKSELEKR